MRQFLTKASSQGTTGKDPSLGESVDSSNPKISSVATMDMPDLFFGPAEIYNSQPGLEAEILANRFAMNPHRINV